MNPDNPYAAPQTVEPRLDLSALPIADLQQPGGQRRRYPELSTAELQRLFDQSQKLEAMFLVWLALWFATVVFVGSQFLHTSASSATPKWLGWILIAVVTARFVCCIWRTKLGRWYMLVVDAVLSVGSVVGWALPATKIAVFSADELFKVGVMGLIALTVALLAYRSCQTLVKARELFYPSCVQHDDLMRELSYRKEQRID